MDIKDLQPRQGKVDLTATVLSKESPREFNKFGKSGKVCNALIKDDSGQVKFTLWNEQVDVVEIGDKIQITNGYVNEYQGEMQLSTGKFGQLKVLEKGTTPTMTNIPPKKDEEEEMPEEEMGDGDEY